MDATPPSIPHQTSPAEDNITESAPPSAGSTTDADPSTTTPLNNVAVLFRHDLRLHDNPTLSAAATNAATLTPIYCFTPTIVYTPTLAHQKRFLLDAIHDLRISLQSKGNNLIIRVGQPEQLLPEICEAHNITTVFTLEREIDDGHFLNGLLTHVLRKKNITLVAIPGNTLYEERDLPFKLHQIQSLALIFNSRISSAKIRNPLPVPTLPPLPNSITPGTIPTLPELGFPEPPTVGHGWDSLEDMPGGETEGLRRVLSFVQGSSVDMAISAEVEPWLKIGCISTRKLFFEYANATSLEIAENSCTCAVLVWRDFYTFFGPKHYRLNHEPEQWERKPESGKRSSVRNGAGPYRGFERS